MKKYIIPSIMILIVILLIIAIVINKDKTTDLNYYDGTYKKITTNYINDEEYSTTTEIIQIINDTWVYKKMIIYNDSKTEDITVTKTGRYTDKHFNLSTGEDVYIEKNRVCFDESKKDCLTKKDKKEDNYINDFNYSDYLINVNSLSEIKDDKYIVVFVRTDSEESKTIKQSIIKILYDFDTKIYLYDLTNANKEELKYWNNYFDLVYFPSTFVFENNSVQNKYEGAMTRQTLAQVLLDNGIKGR